MASPFYIFRKHQKVSLAVITFLAMVAFVFSGLFTRAANNGQTAAAKEPAAATWKFGTITNNEVSRHMDWTAALDKFLQNAYISARNKGAIQLQEVPTFPDKNREYTLDSIVLAKKAETLGIVVSDEAINQYIDEFTDHKLTKEDKENLVASQMGGRNQGNSDQLFEELRFQLLARQMRILLSTDAMDIGTPAGEWNYFCRVTRQAKIEALPVEVKDFVSQVPDPPEDKLQAFFEQYKAALPQAGSPDPGFKIPAKGEFQYFEAVRADFAKQEKPKVTDAQIKDYYDEHKDNFRRSVFDIEDKTSPLFTPDKETPKPDANSKTEPKSKTDDKSKSPLTPKATENEKPVAGDKTAGDKTSGDKGASEKAGEKTPDKSKSDKAGDKTPDKSKTDKPADDKGPAGKSSRNDRSRRDELAPVEYSYPHRGQTELLAFADPDKSDEKSEPAKTEPAKTDTKADAKSEPAKTTPPSPAPAKTEPAKTEPAKTEPGKKTQSKESARAPAKGETPGKSGAKSASGTPAGKTPADAKSNASEHEKYSEYDSVDDPKVRDQIIETLAGEAATKQINDLFKKLHPKISKYSTELARWRAKGSVPADKPPPPDFKAVGKEFGLVFGETGVVSAQEVSEKKGLGKSYSVVYQGEQPRPYPFAMQGFSTSLKAYQTVDSMAADGETDFLWWRTQDLEPAKVPYSLDSVRREVVLAWKMIEARKLAEAKADEYMAEVNRRHVSLKEAYGFKAGMPKIIEPPLFPWLTRRSVPENTEMEEIPPVLSRIEGVEMAGPDFMATVFGLEVGSAGVAFNEPRTVAYVVQLQHIDPRETELRAQFLNRIVNASDPFVRQAFLAAQQDSGQVLREKIQAIEKEFDFEAVKQTGDNQPAGPTGSGDEDD